MSFAGFNIKGFIMSMIGAVVGVAVGVALGPTFTYYMGYINATALSGVALGSIVALIADYAPFFYYLGLAFMGLTAGYAASKKL